MSGLDVRLVENLLAVEPVGHASRKGLRLHEASLEAGTIPPRESPLTSCRCARPFTLVWSFDVTEPIPPRQLGTERAVERRMISMYQKGSLRLEVFDLNWKMFVQPPLSVGATGGNTRRSNRDPVLPGFGPAEGAHAT